MRVLYYFLVLLATSSLSAQTLAERLGYGANAKVLIVQADDLGVTHATNTASFAGLRQGTISSASIMANTPWLPEVARFARENPTADLGMHLVLTSEWRDLKWGTVAPAGSVLSLLDSVGYLPSGCQDIGSRADPEEVRTEIRAQIERARALGIEPTHLDTHMGCLTGSPELFRIYLETAREYGIPAMVSRDRLQNMAAGYGAALTEEDLVVDRIFGAGPADLERGMDSFYRNRLHDLPAGVSVMIIHAALDGAESAGMAGGVEPWGNRWRQLDYNFFTGAAFTELLEAKNIQLVTWRELSERWKQRE